MDYKSQTVDRNMRTPSPCLKKFTAIQPPAWLPPDCGTTIFETGIALFEEALADAPDLICLPEYFNCIDNLDGFGSYECDGKSLELLRFFSEKARVAKCYVVLPMIVDVKGGRYNRATLLGRDGTIVGHYDKVHITEVERTEMGITAGSEWPVFDLDFGTVGIMICYDGCFWETARILALAGARHLCWPSLQRSYTRFQLELQMRAHAYFNYVNIVRSSFGGAMGSEPEAHIMVGLSGVCAQDGQLLSMLDSVSGWVASTIDVNHQLCGARSFGGQIGVVREMRFGDRRTDVYNALAGV